MKDSPNIEGIYDDIPQDVYNHPEFPGIRSSVVKAVAKKSFFHAQVVNSEKSKEHFTQGRIFHELIEGVNPDEIRKKYKLTNLELEPFKHMVDSVKSHPRFEEVYKGARREITFFARCRYTGELLRCRCDLWHPDTNLIADYKTTSDASLDGFSRSAKKFGYRLGACFYAAVVNWATKEPVEEVRLIAIEKEAPYFCAQYRYGSESFELDTELMVDAIRRIKLAREGGNKGYSTQVIDLRY